ncbi:MAG: hypothetical protein Q8898_02245 [Bacillota bacterium]|nr:hypothetical protein [Bacillota bacterium]
MAVVMALGIITQGVLLNYFGTHFFQGSFGKFISIFNLSLWFAFILSFLMAYLDGKFKEIHYSNRINRFGIGTWVAGTSICGILFYIQFFHWGFISEIIAYLNIFLWIIYIAMCLKTLIEITMTKSYRSVHGILLLTTVSTQSIVLLITTVFKELPIIITMPLLIIGFCFYIVCVFFILYRYLTSSWSIEKDWNNTNCILHGALSISGIACIKTGFINEITIDFIWILATVIFCLVESIEVYRLFRRIKYYGIKKGIFIYDLTQWSRVFTFAMFYTFTFLIKPDLLIIIFVKGTILTSGVWIIMILFIIELMLSIIFMVKTYKKSSRENHKKNEVTSSY